MQKTIRLLALLLAAQLVMAVAVGWFDRGLSSPADAAPLIAVGGDRIDRITIEGPDDAKAVLAKAEGQWRIANAGDFPADGKRVEQLLERLQGLHGATPVATSASARIRFKVDEREFERRILLATGDETVATLYLGTSPGLRRIHARVDGEEAIHSVELAAYDVPPGASDWEDKALLAFAQSEVRSLEVAGLRISKADAVARPDGSRPDESSDGGAKQAQAPEAGWVATGLDADERLAAEAVDKLVQRVADLRFVSVRGREARPEYGMEDPVLTMTLTRAGGEPLTYRLGKAPDADDYTLQVSNRAEFFNLGSGTARSLVEAAAREALVESPHEAAEDG